MKLNQYSNIFDATKTCRFLIVQSTKEGLGMTAWMEKEIVLVFWKKKKNTHLIGLFRIRGGKGVLKGRGPFGSML